MAQRARALAHDVPDDVMSAQLLEIAAELEAQADAWSGGRRPDSSETGEGQQMALQRGGGFERQGDQPVSQRAARSSAPADCWRRRCR